MCNFLQLWHEQPMCFWCALFFNYGMTIDCRAIVEEKCLSCPTMSSRPNEYGQPNLSGMGILPSWKLKGDSDFKSVLPKQKSRVIRYFGHRYEIVVGITELELLERQKGQCPNRWYSCPKNFVLSQNTMVCFQENLHWQISTTIKLELKRWLRLMFSTVKLADRAEKKCHV